MASARNPEQVPGKGSARNRPGGNPAGEDTPHGLIEGLSVRIRIDGELGESQCLSSLHSMGEQQTSDALSDRIRVDEHHAQDALRRLTFQGREAHDAAVSLRNSRSAAGELVTIERELPPTRREELGVVPPSEPSSGGPDQIRRPPPQAERAGSRFSLSASTVLSSSPHDPPARFWRTGNPGNTSADVRQTLKSERSGAPRSPVAGPRAREGGSGPSARTQKATRRIPSRSSCPFRPRGDLTGTPEKKGPV
ncbi:hypothetical protein SSPS47_35005 [Streptomyces sp. S4.7]|nr:hypothetical protein SSPS47_35005 [Streptomyces sp. S4.7]